MDKYKKCIFRKVRGITMKNKNLQEELKTLEQQALEIENRKREILSTLEKISHSQEEELSKQAFIQNILDDFSGVFATQNISLSHKEDFWIATDAVNGENIGYIEIKDLSLVRSYLNKQLLAYPLYKFLIGFFSGKGNIEIEWGEKFDYEVLFRLNANSDKDESLKLFAKYSSDNQKISIEIEKSFYSLSEVEMNLNDNEEISLFGEQRYDSFTMVYSYKFIADWGTLPAMLQHAIDRLQQFPQNDSRFSI